MRRRRTTPETDSGSGAGERIKSSHHLSKRNLFTAAALSMVMTGPTSQASGDINPFSDQQPPVGSLVNPNFINAQNGVKASTVEICQFLSSGKNTWGDRGLVYRTDIKKRVGSRRVRVKLGLADIPNSAGTMSNTADGRHALFMNSCERVAINSTVDVDLVAKKKSGKGTKVIASLADTKLFRLKRPGFDGQGQIDRFYGYDNAKKGLKSSELEWNSVSFNLPRALTRSALARKAYGVRVRVVATPNTGQTGVQAASVKPEDMSKVKKHTFSRTSWLSARAK